MTAWFLRAACLGAAVAGAGAAGPEDSVTRPAEFGPQTFHTGTEDLFDRAVHDACYGRQLEGMTKAECVLEAADHFCWSTRWMMLVGEEKGRAVDEALQGRVDAWASVGKPHQFAALELGTYIGYSTVRMARLMPENGILYTVDPWAEYHDRASRLIELAGLTHAVEFLTETAEQVTMTRRDRRAPAFDFVFIDHIKDGYLPALIELENAGLILPGAVVVADNVDVFNCVGYLDYVRSSPNFRCHHFDGSLEFTPRRPDGTPEIRDGVEICIYTPERREL